MRIFMHIKIENLGKFNSLMLIKNVEKEKKNTIKTTYHRHYITI